MRILRMLVMVAVIAALLSGAAATAAEQWSDDLLNGTKVCIVFSDDSYTLISASWSGGAVDGLANGQGKITYVYRDKLGSEIKVQGEAAMRSGKLNGKAKLAWSTGDYYDGCYENGWRTGQGIFKFSNGTVYEGEWKNGMPEGKGVVKGYDGGVYEGEWKNGKYEGWGVYKWPNGMIYEGEWRNGVRDGNGILKDASGKVIYSGLWKNNKEAVLTGQESKQSGLAAGKVEKVLGIPWGASEDEAKAIMLGRPGTKYQTTDKLANNTTRQRYSGPFNDEQAVIIVSFYQGKMFAVTVFHFLSAEQVMEKFNEIKNGMSQRYGSPFKENGKYLDSSAWWVLDTDHRAGLIIVRNDGGQTNQSFATVLSYWQNDHAHLLSTTSGGKEY